MLLLSTFAAAAIAAGSGPLEGQVVVHPANHAWLARHGGGPIFIAGPGDPEDFLYRGARNGNGTRSGDQLAIIDKVARHGANCLYIQAIRSHGGDGQATHNPFNNPADPASGLNAAILDQWASWFAEMDRRGIVIYFFLYDDDASPFGGPSRSIGTTERRAIEGLVDRFEGFRNIVWIVAEEYAEAHSTGVASQIAAIIRSADDHDHVVGIHQNDGGSFDFANNPAFQQFAMQRNGQSRAGLHNAVAGAFNQAAGRYNVVMSEADVHYNASAPDRAHTRRYSWAAAMGGGYVMVLSMDVAGTPADILADHGRLRLFFESTRFAEMAPHDELRAGGTEYVLARPGEVYIAYSSSLSGGMGVRGLRAGTYDLRWFDPATGASQAQAVTVAAGDRTFAKPASMGAEVALWLVRRGSGSGCPADFDGNGTLTLNDFAVFRGHYVVRDSRADFNGSGGIDLADLIAFRNAYISGCP